MKKTSILVVDDHPAIRSTMLDILEEEGFSAEQAVNGEEALSKCLENEYDFVLMDVQMPELNGIQVLAKIRDSKQTQSKFIFFSAYSVPELEEQAVALGSYAFLRKPIQVEKIIDLIRDKRGIPILIHLEDDHMRTCLSNLLKNQGYQAIETEKLDDALIQLRQINYSCLIYDSDSAGFEQDALTSTIKSLQTDTICITTNEDELASEVVEKVGFLTEQKKKGGANYSI
ncbi:response regulator [Verrucomicrobia bacterium]|nr:response regulator [Verrucomicrobiota bacterium]